MTKLVPLRCGIAAAALLLLSTLVSCTSYIPFTNHLRGEFHLDNEALRHVQFYVSSNVVLRRDLPLDGGKLTIGGVVRRDEGRLVEEILVRKHTPGIVLASVFEAEPPKSQLHVSFMPGDNTNHLVFAVPDGEQPGSDAPFALSPSLFENELPKIKYDNKVWSVNLSKPPQLMIRKAAFYKLKRIIRILPGRVIAP